MDWFLYDNSFRHERVKQSSLSINSISMITASVMKELSSQV